jgi:hypothetical protein
MIDLAAPRGPLGPPAERHPALAQALGGLGFREACTVVGWASSGAATPAWVDDAGTVAVAARWGGEARVRLTTLLADGTLVLTLQRTGPPQATVWAGSGLDVGLVDEPDLAVQLALHRARVGTRAVADVDGVADVVGVLRVADTLTTAVSQRQAAVQRAVKMAATVGISGTAALACATLVLGLDLLHRWGPAAALALVALGGVAAVLASIAPALGRITRRVADLWVRHVPPFRSAVRPSRAPDNPFAP